MLDNNTNEKPRNYTLEDYEKLHEAVLLYQCCDDKTASEYIINSFSVFLNKYLKLVCRGVFDINDKYIRSFVSLFCNNTKTIAPDTTNYKYRIAVTQKLQQSVYCITKRYCECDEKDVKHELICTLLMMAKNYKDYFRFSFHTYVQKCFHFTAYRALERLTDEITTPFTEDITSIQYARECENRYAIQQNNIHGKVERLLTLKNTNKLTVDEKYSINDERSLNYNWINGITCSSVFSVLTPVERDILIDYYIHNKTDSQIAEKHKRGRVTINHKRLRSIEKLRTALHKKE